MTFDSMIKELEQNGYTVIKNNPDVKWTSTAWDKVWNYIYESRPHSCNKSEDEYMKAAIRGRVRFLMKSEYGYASFMKVPADKIPEIIDFIYENGIKYYNERYLNNKT